MKNILDDHKQIAEQEKNDDKNQTKKYLFDYHINV